MSARRLAVCFAALLGFSIGAAPAFAAAPSAGAVHIVESSGSSTPRNAGGSATPFSLKLPSGAECQRDSANGNYRVQTFLVPAGSADPGSIVYQSQRPGVANGWALYDTFTHPYIQMQTANQDFKDGPGAILGMPTFNYAVFLHHELHPGRYRLGVACSLFNETKRYWSTEIAFVSDASDKPLGLRWRALTPEAAPASAHAPQIIGGAMLAAIAAFVFVTRRRG